MKVMKGQDEWRWPPNTVKQAKPQLKVQFSWFELVGSSLLKMFRMKL